MKESITRNAPGTPVEPAAVEGVFELFDPKSEFDVNYSCNLPHWHQVGATYFITFRTDDSIPVSLARSWYRRRDDWLRRHGIDPQTSDWRKALNGLSRDSRQEFHETFSRQFLDYLDQGYGDCQLRKPDLARIVADSLLHFDGARYHMGDFVVMPNHVHLVVCILGDIEPEVHCYSWKKFTVTQINRRLGRKGRFWQEESFDHLIRNPDQFDAIRKYIANNPASAGLRVGEYYHYKRAS